MAHPIHTILATINTDHSTHVALDKAERLAKQTGAKLHLLTSTYDPIMQYADFVSAHDLSQLRQHVLTNKETLINDLIATLDQTQCPCRGHVSFAPNIADAIDEIGDTLAVDLVIKRKSDDLSEINPFHTPTDRQCIRQAKRPLWLVSDEDVDYQSIVVAIDPITHDDEHAKVNERLVYMTQWLAAHYDAQVKFVHAYDPPIQTVGFEIAAFGYEELLDNVIKHHESAMQEFAQTYAIPDEDCMVVQGNPDQVIANTCIEEQSDLLVIGTIGRSGLSAFFLGNTAEAVLAKVHCEVLCIPAEEAAD